MKIIGGIIIIIVLAIVAVLIFSPKPPAHLEEAQVVDRVTDGEHFEGDGHDHEEGEFDDDHADEEEGDDHGDERPSVTVPNSALQFSFVGFGPGKSHSGTFAEYQISNVVLNEDWVPESGTVTFFVDSVKTDSATLDDHLCRENFFDCANHPTIVFDFVSAETNDGANFTITGNLTFKGIEKAISFPAVKNENSVSADFKINTAGYGFGSTGVNEEVQITFTGSL